jgi:predicted metal-dependent hydrolase
MRQAADEYLARGARLFDEGAFFEAHEAWEDVWSRETDESRRRLLQGLIQVAAGFHKLVVVGSADSALRLLTKGLTKLDACPPSIMGPEIAAFCQGVHACAEALKAHAFVVPPKIQMRDP